MMIAHAKVDAMPPEEAAALKARSVWHRLGWQVFPSVEDMPKAVPVDPNVQRAIRRQVGGCKGCGDPGGLDV